MAKAIREFRKGYPYIRSKKQLLRFIKKAGCTPLQRRMALILAEVIDFTSARNYVIGIMEREDA